MVVRLDADGEKACDWNDVLPGCRDRWISVVVGNTSCIWSMANGSSGDCTPAIFWRTPTIGPEEMKDPRPLDALTRHLPVQAHDEILRIPSSTPSDMTSTPRPNAIAISVFVVSTNRQHEKSIQYLFSSIPSRVFRLENNDFFSVEKGCYPTFGVDRAAALYGAKQFAQNKPVLVLDGGTAWTYTALSQKGEIMGGGIAPGLGARFRCLSDYCGDLPLIDYEYYAKIVQDISNGKKQQLPVFAKDTKTAMISPIFQEVSGQCRNIVKQFLQECKTISETSVDSAGIQTSPNSPQVTENEQSKEQAQNPSSSQSAGENEKISGLDDDVPHVIVTGGDSGFLRMLMEYPGTVVREEPGMLFPHAAFKTKELKYVSHYGIGQMLNQRNLDRGDLAGDEKLRNLLLGQRVAKYFAIADKEGDHIYRGTIVAVTRGKSVEDDFYQVTYDDNDQEELTSEELYRSLKYYEEVGEKSTADPLYWNGTRKEEAVKLSGASAQKMAESHPKLAELKPIVVPKLAAQVTSPARASIGTPTTQNINSTRKRNPKKADSPATSVSSSARKRAPGAQSPKKPAKKAKANNAGVQSKMKYINLRVAKFFPGFSDLFLGKVVSYDAKLDLWRIEYDDGDSEEYDEADMRESLKLIYEERRNELNPQQAEFAASVLKLAVKNPSADASASQATGSSATREVPSDAQLKISSTVASAPIPAADIPGEGST